MPDFVAPLAKLGTFFYGLARSRSFSWSREGIGRVVMRAASRLRPGQEPPLAIRTISSVWARPSAQVAGRRP